MSTYYLFECGGEKQNLVKEKSYCSVEKYLSELF